MKKICLLLSLLFVSMAAWCEDNAQADKPRNKYFNIGFSRSKLNQDDFPQLKSKWGAALNVGKTFYLHKKPVLKFLRFGIDATWFDLTYGQYKVETIVDRETFHHAEAAMQVGPSVTFTPISGLNVNAYFRYAPTFSALYCPADNHYDLGYATRLVGGASVTYKFIGVGIESRFGWSKVDEFSQFLGYGGDDRESTKLTGFRVYISFRY